MLNHIIYYFFKYIKIEGKHCFIFNVDPKFSWLCGKVMTLSDQSDSSIQQHCDIEYFQFERGVWEKVLIYMEMENSWSNTTPSELNK